jgi:hypothetical protein
MVPVNNKVSEKTAEHPFKVVATRVRPVQVSEEDVSDPRWYAVEAPHRDETQEPEYVEAIAYCVGKSEAASLLGEFAYLFPSSQGFRVKVLPGGAR